MPVDRLDGSLVQEDNGLWRIDTERWRANMAPATRRNHDRRRVAWRVEFWLLRNIPWMRWPLLSYVYGFWTRLMEDGWYSTLKPRWGGITFSYLNDGMKPTVWHTWQQVMHPRGKYDGIWPKGAPRNKAEADRTL